MPKSPDVTPKTGLRVLLMESAALLPKFTGKAATPTDSYISIAFFQNNVNTN